jgi:uncharacterized membrane protein
MGRIELIFIGVVLGVLIVVGLYLFGSAMIELGRKQVKKELNKMVKGVKNK